MVNWKDVALEADDSLSDAIGVLERTGLRIVLIVNKEEKLLGTVTDGDIRRAMIRNVDFDSPVSGVMNSTPKKLLAPADIDHCKSIMRENRLLQLPIVDENGTVMDLVCHDSLSETVNFDNVVFIMAGGFGKRLHPYTRSTPKPMLNVGGKPILEHIIVNCRDAGFSKFYISTHFLPEVITDYFANGEKWGVNISYVHEEQPLGTAGALGLLPTEEIDAPVLMINGDILTAVDFSSLRNFHYDKKPMATVCVSEYKTQIPFGVIEHDDYKIKEISEKPTFQFFVNSGIYFLEPDILKAVKSNETVDMPSVLKQMISQGHTINMFPLHENWADIGRPDDLKNANEVASASEF